MIWTTHFWGKKFKRERLAEFETFETIMQTEKS